MNDGETVVKALLEKGVLDDLDPPPWSLSVKLAVRGRGVVGGSVAGGVVGASNLGVMVPSAVIVALSDSRVCL
jgi:hypothetical protein